MTTLDDIAARDHPEAGGARMELTTKMLLDEWVRTGGVPHEPAGGWTVPRIVATIQREAVMAERGHLLDNFDRMKGGLTPDQAAAVAAVLFASADVPDEAHMERYAALRSEFSVSVR